MSEPAPDKRRSFVTAAVLAFTIGNLGADRFYLGYFWLGMLKLLTFGGCCVWTTIDCYLIMSDQLPDADGNPLRK